MLALEDLIVASVGQCANTDKETNASHYQPLRGEIDCQSSSIMSLFSAEEQRAKMTQERWPQISHQQASLPCHAIQCACH